MTAAVPAIVALTLTTDRLLLRRPQADDIEPFATYIASDRTKFVGGPQPRRRAYDRLGNFAGHWLLRGFGRYIGCDRATGRPLGHFGAFQHDEDIPPEMAWSIWDGADTGKGLAQEASRAVLNHYRKRGWPLVCARIDRGNVESIAVAQALGFSQNPAHSEGDVLRYDLDLTQGGAA